MPDLVSPALILVAGALLSVSNGLFTSDGGPSEVAVNPMPVPDVEPVAVLDVPSVFTDPLDADLDALDDDVDALFADLDLETL